MTKPLIKSSIYNIVRGDTIATARFTGNMHGDKAVFSAHGTTIHAMPNEIQKAERADVATYLGSMPRIPKAIASELNA